METMVERVARAICSQLDDDWENVPENKVEWNMHDRAKNGIHRAEHELFREDYRLAARAAIEAMREPSDDLLKAAKLKNDQSGAPFCTDWSNFRSQLNQVIDAALSESMKEK